MGSVRDKSLNKVKLVCAHSSVALTARTIQPSMSLSKHLRAVVPASSAARSFLLLALAIGAFYTAINPPFAVNDEREHWLRVVEITKGRLRSRSDERGPYHQLPQDYYALITRYGSVQRKGEARVHRRDLFRDLQAPAQDPPQWRRRVANASGYSPLPYLPHIGPVWFARQFDLPPLWQIYFARVSSLVTYALITSWAVAIAGPMSWAFFVLGLMPMSLTQAAGLSGDGMTQALSFLFFAWVAKGTFAAELSRKERGLLLGMCAAVTLCKPPYLLHTLSLLALKWTGPRASLKRWGFAAAGLIAGILPAAIWNYLNQGAEAGPSPAGEQLALLEAQPAKVITVALLTLAERTDDYLIEFVAVRDVIHRQMRFLGGLLSGLYLPILAAVTWGVSYRAGRGARLRALWCLVSGLATSGAIFLAMYLYSTPVGGRVIYGAQGRYFIPVAPALLLVASTYGRPVLARWLAARSGIRLKVALTTLNAVCLVALIARYYATSKIDWPY